MRKIGKFHILNIYCSNCNTLIYKYRKVGRGHLVKCYKDRIVSDFTNNDLKCPECNKIFARETMIRSKPANKISQGKVYTKGFSLIAIILTMAIIVLIIIGMYFGFDKFQPYYEEKQDQIKQAEEAKELIESKQQEINEALEKINNLE